MNGIVLFFACGYTIRSLILPRFLLGWLLDGLTVPCTRLRLFMAFLGFLLFGMIGDLTVPRHRIHVILIEDVLSLRKDSPMEEECIFGIVDFPLRVS